VRGLQEGPDAKHLRVIAALKHFAAYSVEDARSWRDFNISTFDLQDTYLPHFRESSQKACCDLTWGIRMYLPRFRECSAVGCRNTGFGPLIHTPESLRNGRPRRAHLV
jgi:hypothetical protein